MKLLKVDTLNQAVEKIKSSLGAIGFETEEVTIGEAWGRVLAEDVVSEENIPDFRRSTVDGYAVLAADTQGASESVPSILQVKGQVLMGKPAEGRISSGECVYIPTGGMLPDGADAVVMIEHTEALTAGTEEKQIAEGELMVFNSLAPGQNVTAPAEDIAKGDSVVPAGRKLTAQDIAAMAALGKSRIKVYRKPTLAIISTGDEVVPINETPRYGQVRDINSYGIMGLALEHGFDIVSMELLQDEEKLLEEAVAKAMERADMVIVSGGSSQGKKDATAGTIDALGDPGVLTHGIALKPGKPTIIGYDRETATLMMGLPGHPAAAMMVFRLILVRAIRELMGQREEICINAVMETNLASAPGRATAVPVRLEDRGEEIRAIPILGKSGAITTLSSADGYILTEVNDEGLAAGRQVKVHLF
ncbi:MAG: gephyrin-like molybdotransferase Glp [Lentihominibacter sp.]